MSFISDFFDGVTDNLVPALIVAGVTYATGGAGAAALAWKGFVPAIGGMAIVGGRDRDDLQRDDGELMVAER